jgi:hypothetical protein
MLNLRIASPYGDRLSYRIDVFSHVTSPIRLSEAQTGVRGLSFSPNRAAVPAPCCF